MRITSIDTVVVGNPWKNWVFALVHTDEGISGVGEGTVNGFAGTVEAAIRDLESLVVGEDPRRISWLSRRMQRDVYSDGGQVHRAAQAAIEVALWDILGRSLNVPVWQLLGGKVRDRVRAYANGWYRNERTPQAMAEAATHTVERGYTALKFDPFGSSWRVMGRDDLALARDLVAAVRDAVGPDVDVLIEGHCRFSVAQALEIADLLAPFRPTWFEEPVRHDRVTAVAEVARHSPIPIATGESFHNLGEFVELAEAGPVGFWQPEPIHIGGLGPTMQVFGIAEAYDSVVAPHQAGGPIATVLCLHLAASMPNHYVQELFDEFNEPWEKDLVSWHPPLGSDGHLPIPDGPGLGSTLNLDVAAEHPGSRENVLPIYTDGWESRVGVSHASR